MYKSRLPSTLPKNVKSPPQLLFLIPDSELPRLYCLPPNNGPGLLDYYATVVKYSFFWCSHPTHFFFQPKRNGRICIFFPQSHVYLLYGHVNALLFLWVLQQSHFQCSSLFILSLHFPPSHYWVICGCRIIMQQSGSA